MQRTDVSLALPAVMTGTVAQPCISDTVRLLSAPVSQEVMAILRDSPNGLTLIPQVLMK